MAYINGKEILFSVQVGAKSGGAIELANIPVVNSIDNPNDDSPTVVIYNGEIYLLIKENKNG